MRFNHKFLVFKIVLLPMFTVEYLPRTAGYEHRPRKPTTKLMLNTKKFTILCFYQIFCIFPLKFNISFNHSHSLIEPKQHPLTRTLLMNLLWCIAHDLVLGGTISEDITRDPGSRLGHQVHKVSCIWIIILTELVTRKP